MYYTILFTNLWIGLSLGLLLRLMSDDEVANTKPRCLPLVPGD